MKARAVHNRWRYCHRLRRRGHAARPTSGAEGLPRCTPWLCVLSLAGDSEVSLQASALLQVMQPQSGGAAGDLDLNVVAVQREVSAAR